MRCTVGRRTTVPRSPVLREGCLCRGAVSLTPAVRRVFQPANDKRFVYYGSPEEPGPVTGDGGGFGGSFLPGESPWFVAGEGANRRRLGGLLSCLRCQFYAPKFRTGEVVRRHVWSRSVN